MIRKKKKSRIRIRGTDRAIMMLWKDARRRWLQYGENRKEAVVGLCVHCGAREAVEGDHIERVGARPRTPEEFGPALRRMLYGKCQGLCEQCHGIKTKAEREALKAAKGTK